jgi:hypothetical protein
MPEERQLLQVVDNQQAEVELFFIPRFSRDRYLRIGWFAGEKLSTAAFKSECRSKEVQCMIAFSPDSLINQRERIFRILSGRTSFISSQRIRFSPLFK